MCHHDCSYEQLHKVIQTMLNAAAPCEVALPISSPKDKGMMSLNDSTTDAFMLRCMRHLFHHLYLNQTHTF